MAFNQLNPALLQGEDLRRWYQRSPQEIEEERQAAAEARYQAFFHPQELAAGLPAASFSPASDGVERPTRAPPRERGWASIAAQGTARPMRSSLAPAAATAAVTGTADCLSCHGRAKPPAPFPFPFPSPWIFPPATRDIPKTPPADAPRGPPRQCDIQNARDTEICTRQPNPTARAMCHESASERYAYCIKSKGEVGHPRLFTHPDGPHR